MSQNNSNERPPRSESAEYSQLLQEAETTDLSRVLKSGCVTVGRGMDGFPVIAFIPTVGFDYGDKSDQTWHQIYLLFVKIAHPIVSSGQFSLVYSRKSTDWRKPLVYEYYKMLPESVKKNLFKLYVIAPQVGIRMFFAITRVFVSAEFYKKLVFVENIAEFQRIIPPRKLILPYNFLSTEDNDRALKCSGVSVPLLLDFEPSFGTTSIMKRCTTYLRESGGLRRVGLFRVAGSENQLSLVRVRLQPPIYFSKAQMKSYMNCIMIGVNDDYYKDKELIDINILNNTTLNLNGTRNKKLIEVSINANKDKGDGSNNMNESGENELSYNLSTVVVTEIESVAQTLKLALRDLPEPLFTFKAFDILMKITQVYDRKQCTFEQWYSETSVCIDNMPLEHKSTLCFLLDFLREVAAESAHNQMDVYNLSTIFAPTLLRPKQPDFTNPAKAFNEVRLCQLVIKYLLEIPKEKREVGISTLLQNDFYTSLTTVKENLENDDDDGFFPKDEKEINNSAGGNNNNDDLIFNNLNVKMKGRVTSYARPSKVNNNNLQDLNIHSLNNTVLNIQNDSVLNIQKNNESVVASPNSKDNSEKHASNKNEESEESFGLTSNINNLNSLHFSTHSSNSNHNNNNHNNNFNNNFNNASFNNIKDLSSFNLENSGNKPPPKRRNSDSSVTSQVRNSFHGDVSYLGLNSPNRGTTNALRMSKTDQDL